MAPHYVLCVYSSGPFARSLFSRQNRLDKQKKLPLRFVRGEMSRGFANDDDVI
jgi:hypothetical protein